LEDTTMWFKNLRTVTKLVLAFGLMAVITGVIGYKGVTAAADIDAMLNSMYNRDLLGIAAVQRGNVIRLTIARDLRNALIYKDKARKEEMASSVSKSFNDLDESLTQIDKTVVSEDSKARMAKARELIPEYKKSVDGVLVLSLAGKNDEAAESLDKAQEIGNQVSAVFNALVEHKEKGSKQFYDDATVLYSSTRTLLIWMIVAAVALCMGIGYFIARLISKPLLATVGVLEKVAEGDMTARLELDTTDEVGQMAAALNRATEAIRLTLADVRTSADNMSNSAQQLAAASEELASGAQEQASALEETSASLEEITSTIKQNADNAKQANQVANGSRDAAEKGGQVVGEAVGAMVQINESSKNIAEIISTIDEIAFQTNLLALNAAVEAARAGEQGRGFAVVATEVRNLAQRSATSAKEIKRLIQDSTRKVENGSALVNKSGDTLREIVGSVKRVTDIVAEIAAASQEQSIGVEQVNKAVTQMDQVTQTNASQTEELSATAQSMAAASEELQAVIARFRLDSGGMQPGVVVTRAQGPKSKLGDAHGGKPARKALARQAAAAGGSASVAVTRMDAPNDQKEQAHAFEDF
jgi:methyl-accepting chemotaxis protein